nr:hypothetical protein [Tanacetum cinerariifolium]
MPSPITKKPFTKPPTEKHLLVFIKRLGCDEDPKELMTSIPTFIATRLHQPWRVILSVLNRCLTGENTSWDRARLPSVGYKFYKMKKDESGKVIAKEEPKEQYVSPVRSGRGKGYLCIGNQEVNVSSKPKKVVVLSKPRIITEADNLIEQEAVELAKSVSIEEQRL